MRTAALALTALASTASAQLHDPFPPIFELSQLLPENGGDGSLGFVVQGRAAREFLGHGAAHAGDFNADGIDDVAIGAPGVNVGGHSDAGETYVIFGRSPLDQSFPPLLAIESLDGVNGLVVEGLTEFDPWFQRGSFGDISGAHLACAGDFNSDGIDDLVIGALGAGMDRRGATFVVFGSPEPFPRRLPLSSLDGANGVRINGAEPFDLTGEALGAPGDVNGDAIDDLTIGNHRASLGYPRCCTGAAWTVLGSADPFPPAIELSQLDGTNGFYAPGFENQTSFAESVSIAGDINNDGLDDLLIGVPFASPHSFEEGSVYVVYGRPKWPQVLDVLALDGAAGFRIDGSIHRYPRGNIGEQISTSGDINADGIDDIVLGNESSSIGEHLTGAAHVIFGREEPFPHPFCIDDLPPGTGFAMHGVRENDTIGSEVAIIPDINGDEIDDLIVSGKWANNRTGESYVVFGSTETIPFSFSAADLDGTNGFRLDGFRPRGCAGFQVAPAGDINHDGVRDILITAALSEVNGLDRAGEAYIIFGRHQPCPADLTGSSHPSDPTYGVRDGDADSDDLFFLLDAFANADTDTCDIDQDADDFSAYLGHFAAGCG